MEKSIIKMVNWKLKLNIIFKCWKILEMVRFNKTLQKKLNINLINYRIFSGKYIIYESNGIVKEYDSYNDKLIFEGEYLNGKRNGKGKEYNKKGKLIFEGEYLNGEKILK